MSTHLSLAQAYARMAMVPLFVVLMRPTPRYDPESAAGQELMRAHLQWQLELEDEGRLFAAGPLNHGRPVSEGHPIVNAGGMYVLAAADRAEAEAIAAREPFGVAGWRTHVVCTWLLNEGVGRGTAASVAERFGAR